MPDRCRSCKQPIRWAVTVGGHPMPLDYDPVAGGNLRLEPPTNGAVPRATAIPPSYRTPGEQLYRSHFASCPFADRHRNRTR